LTLKRPKITQNDVTSKALSLQKKIVVAQVWLWRNLP